MLSRSNKTNATKSASTLNSKNAATRRANKAAARAKGKVRSAARVVWAGVAEGCRKPSDAAGGWR